MRLRSALLHLVRDAAVVAALTITAIPATVLAGTPAGGIESGVCQDGPDTPLAELEAAIDAANARAAGEAFRIADNRAAVTVLFAPEFHGPRAFNEPSAVDVTASVAWNPAPMVSHTDASAEITPVIDRSVVSQARRTDLPHLAAHFFYGAGGRLKEITVDPFCAQISEMVHHPVRSAICSPANFPVGMVCMAVGAGIAAPSLVASARTGVHAFLNPTDYGQQAETIGARSVDAFLILASFSEGTGLAAFDGVAVKRGGRSVIGSFPQYIKLAKETGAHYFSISPSEWDAMTETDRWATNRAFLDERIADGDTFEVTLKDGRLNEDSYTAKEIDHLQKAGYEWSFDGKFLLPPQGGQ